MLKIQLRILYCSLCFVLFIGEFAAAQPAEPWFEAGINYSTASQGNNSVAAGDLDGDGDKDVVVGTAKGVAVLVNQGDGIFAPPVYYLADYGDYTATLIDIDGDGDTDLIGIADRLYILVNNGTGSFSLSGSYDTGNTPFDVCGTDLNGDDDIDLAVTNYWDNSLSVLINNGDGFVPAGYYSVAGHPRSVVAADLDLDGDDDLAIASESWQGLSLLFNDGLGSFGPAVNSAWGLYSWDLVADDFDDDGDADLIVTHDGLMLLENRGNVTFASHWVDYYWDADGFVCSGDIDGDGNRDFVGGGRYSDQTSIFRNNEDWWFERVAGFSSTSPGSPNCLADLDGDGYQDLVIANGDVGVVSVFKNDGNGNFVFAPSYPAGPGPRSVKAADFDRDGDDDLAVAAGGEMYIMFNDGIGSFDAVSGYDDDLGSQLCVADFNSDGFEDIAVEYLPSNHVLIYMNDGDGTFYPGGSCLVGGNIVSIVSADFDGDGDRDLVIAAGHTYLEQAGNLSIFANDGLGSFVQCGSWETTELPCHVCPADFNRDDAIDLAVANCLTDRVSVFIGNGDGTFASATDYNVGHGPKYIVSGDFDGDGSVDLASLNQSYETISLLSNDGYGLFSVETAFTSTNGGHSICAGDYDGDGVLDLALARATIAILRGNGDFTFEEIHDFSVGRLPLEVCASDLDGNGSLDLAACNYASGTVSILKNRTDAQTGLPFDPNADELPHQVILEQNYPNPFNPNTEIVFALLANSRVNLAVYNIVGQRVVTLVDRPMKAGYHSVTWNGKSSSGKEAATGIYFYKLTAGGFVSSKKMLLIK